MTRSRGGNFSANTLGACAFVPQGGTHPDFWGLARRNANQRKESDSRFYGLLQSPLHAHPGNLVAQ